MSKPLTVLAEGGEHWPPGVKDFFLPSLYGGAISKITVLVWIAVAVLIIFFTLSYRNPQLVPTRMQWIAESLYGGVRNGIAKEVIGHEGLRFAPYLATLFCFILLTNLFGIIPLAQISPNSHIAFPIMLAVISYAMFNYIGIRKHGFVKYMKMNLIPPAPWPVLIILIPIEFISTFLVRPVTLSLRLFANMFAGHLILLVFTLGGFILLSSDSWALKPVALVSWATAIVMTFFEAIVAILQAYIFVVLSSTYLEGALADEH